MSANPKNFVRDDHCPICGTAMGCATHPTDDDARPKPGDLSFCIYCGSVLAFEDDLRLRKATPSEASSVAEQIAEMREALAKVKGFAA